MRSPDPDPDPDPDAEAGAAAPALRVLYDGACPLRRREIGIYRGLQQSTLVCFADVTDPTQPLPSGTTREQLLSRLLVATPTAACAAAPRPSWLCGPYCPGGDGWRASAACPARPGRWSASTGCSCACGRCSRAGLPASIDRREQSTRSSLTLESTS